MTKPKFAFQVRATGDDYEEEAVIVFAWTEGHARSRGYSRMIMEVDEPSDLKVKRTPEYDRHCQQGYVPPVELIHDGWYLPCDHCGTMVDEGAEDDDTGEPYEYCQAGKYFYCSTDCMEAHKERREYARIRCAQAKAYLLSKYRGITGLKIYQFNLDEVTAYFRFPGGKYQAEWSSKHPDSATIRKVDLDAWQAAIGPIKEAVEA